jgi:hypothetical protein
MYERTGAFQRSWLCTEETMQVKETNLGTLIPDWVKTEAPLGVIQKPEVLIGLGNGNHI